MSPTQTAGAHCAELAEALHRLVGSAGRPGVGPAQTSTSQPATDVAPQIRRLPLQLVFDSTRSPLPTGQRDGEAEERHLVYMSGDYAVDLRIGTGESDAGEMAVLEGELISSVAGPVAEVQAVLLCGEEIAGYTSTGALGEFRFQAAVDTDLRICLLLDKERCIELPIEACYANPSTARP